VIPGVANPQAWNRFSYTLNSPIRFNDPTGHAISCDAEDDCTEVRADDKLSVEEYVNKKLSKYKVYLIGDKKKWDNFHMIAALAAVVAVGNKLATTLNNVSGAQAFREVYGYVNIGIDGTGAQGDCIDIDVGGCTTNSNQINFALNGGSPNWAGDYVSDSQFLRNRNNVVHELAHTFGSNGRGLGAFVGG